MFAKRGIDWNNNDEGFHLLLDISEIHSDVVGASPVGAAPTTSSFST